MLKQKKGQGNMPWGRTSLFSHKSGPKRAHGISKEDKERFFISGILPKIKNGPISEKQLQKQPVVETELLPESITILNKVREEFGNGDNFVEAAYGKRIEASRASEVIHNYLVEHGIDGMMSVYFSPELNCSGKMSWTGPLNKYNQPERRNYSMWIKNAPDNIYLRETGILNLSNHEIGTHFLRSLNDGLQPWFSNRSKFGIGPYKSRDLKDTEEGLAALNTTFESNVRYIWGPAMLYYATCMSLEMNFKDLFDHLHKYVADPEIRWKYVARIKHGRNPMHLGGHGKDQCYFRGAVNILRNLDYIDFLLLHTGKITVEDQCRIQRIARMGCIKIPYFLKDMRNYRKHLRIITKMNGITKPKTPIIKEPLLKITLPKPEPCPKQDKFGKKQQGKKPNSGTVQQAKQRILSTKLLAKSKFASPDELSKMHMFLEDRDTPDPPCEIDQLPEFPDVVEFSGSTTRSTPVDAFPPLVVGNSTSPSLVEEVDSLEKPTSENNNGKPRVFRICSEDNPDPHFNGIPDMQSVGAKPTATHAHEGLKMEKLELNPTQDLTKVETTAILKYTTSAKPLLTPSAKSATFESSTTPVRDVTGVTSSTPQTVQKEIFVPTRRPSKNVTQRSEKSRSRSVNVYKPSHRDKDSAQSSNRGAEKCKPTRVEKNQGTPRKTSPPTPKKGVKEKFSQFFSELIPFSRSRRKRVLPLPVN